MIAYCGLNCAKCDGYLAARSDDKDKIAAVAKKWSIRFGADIKPEQVLCDGCRGKGRVSFHCGQLCGIRKCCLSKKIHSCSECSSLPCEDLLSLDRSPESAYSTEN